MAITKDYLNTNDFTVITSWMNQHLVPTYFNSVTYADSTITCKDSDDHTILTITSGYVVTLYASASLSKVFNNGVSLSKVTNASMCANGCLIEFYGSASGAALLITKTNNNVVSVTYSIGAESSGIKGYLGTYTCVAWGDISPIESFSCTPITTAQQTQIMPFLSNAPYGTVSYTPNAFLIPIGQYYTMGTGQLTLNGNIYLCNGYWAVKDGTVPTS